MTTYTFEESGLLFQFSPAWKVLRWDKSPYYKKVSGRGFKGVDFIGIYQQKLYLIEVKNYQPRTSNHSALVNRLASPQHLLEHMTIKVDDTLRLLELVAVHLRNKWWIKTAEWLFQIGLLPAWKSSSYHWWLESDAFARAGADRVSIVLWLELAVEYTGLNSFDAPGFRKDLETLLKSEFKDYTQTVEIVHIAHSGGIPECKVETA